MNPLLLQQFTYDLWANKRWLAFLSETRVHEDAASILVHILLAQASWVARVEGGLAASITPPPLQEGALDDLFSHWREVLESRAGDELISYLNRAGRQMESTLEDIALHVVNHGTYHRGELRGLCRAMGVENFPETDRIKFTWELHEIR